MWIQCLTSGPLQTNAFLAGAEISSEAVLIDAPPGSYDAVQQALAESGRSLCGLLITHSHFDHILDAWRFTRDGISLMAHAGAGNTLRKPSAMGLLPEPPEGFPPADISGTLSGNDTFSLAGLEIEVLEVPGHSPDSLAFHIPNHQTCFAGDLIFRGAVGRTDIPGGDFDLLAESIQNRIYTLPEATRLYSGHGPDTDVGREKHSNPFVRG